MSGPITFTLDQEALQLTRLILEFLDMDAY